MSNVEDDLDALDGDAADALAGHAERSKQARRLGEGELPDPDLPSPMVPAEPQLPSIMPTSPMEMVGRALERGITGDTLQQFMDLQERYEANEARKAYAADMAKCQARMPAIVADTPNTQTDSLYAKLGKINAAIAPVYTKQGFSISFDEIPIEGEMIRTRGRVIHKLGHIEEFTYDLPLDIGGIRGNENKTAVHAKGSTTTYARRYLTTMIFNLAVGDDLDGNLPSAANGRVDEDQAMTLNAAIDEWEINGDPILREFGVLQWDQLPTKKFQKALDRITQIGRARQQR